MRRTTLKIDAFALMTKTLASLSTSSSLKVGCIIFKEDFSKIAAIGYNGSYINAPIHEATGTEEESLEPGQSGFIHAEINAIAKFNGHTPHKYIVLVTHSPCAHCTKVLINAGFTKIYWIEQYREVDHLEFILNRVNAQYGTIEDLKRRYDPNHGLDTEMYSHLYGKSVMLNDQFSSTHIWSEELAIKNNKVWTPKEINIQITE
jgi:dCMP deaminase